MDRPLICGHSDAGGGQWLYPDGTTCTSTRSPIRCTHDGNAIELKRVATFGTNHELRYTCCLPHSCNNANTDMITANIYCKSFKIIVISYLLLVNIFIIDITVELPLDVTAIPQQYKINCIIAGKNVNKLNFYYDDTDLTGICNGQGNGFSCTTMTENGLTSDITPSRLRRDFLKAAQ